MRPWLPLVFLSLAAPAIAADHVPTAKDVESFEYSRVLEPYTSYDRSGRGTAEFGPNIVVRNAGCEKTDRPKVFRCRYESQVSDWGGSDGPWTSREILIRRDRKGCWREVV